MSIELAIDTLLRGQRCAYYAPTYKDSYEWWKQIKGTAGAIIQSKDEQVKQLTTITGGLIDVWSMDDPDSGRGRKYHRAIMDECEKAPKFREAWLGTIRATLTDFKGTHGFCQPLSSGRRSLRNYPAILKSLPTGLAGCSQHTITRTLTRRRLKMHAAQWIRYTSGASS